MQTLQLMDGEPYAGPWRETVWGGDRRRGREGRAGGASYALDGHDPLPGRGSLHRHRRPVAGLRQRTPAHPPAALNPSASTAIPSTTPPSWTSSRRAATGPTRTGAKAGLAWRAGERARKPLSSGSGGTARGGPARWAAKCPSIPRSRSAMSPGTRPTRSRAGPGSACPPKPSGRLPPAGIRSAEAHAALPMGRRARHAIARQPGRRPLRTGSGRGAIPATSRRSAATE